MGCPPSRPLIGQAPITTSGVPPHERVYPQRLPHPRGRFDARGARASASTDTTTPCTWWGQHRGARRRWGPLAFQCRSRLAHRERCPARSHACVGGRPARCACPASDPLYSRRLTPTPCLTHCRGLCRGARGAHRARRSPLPPPPRALARHWGALSRAAAARTLGQPGLSHRAVPHGSGVAGAMDRVRPPSTRGHRARGR